MQGKLRCRLDIFARFTECVPIEKGWSGDKKYRVTDETGTVFLLRISPAERYEQRKFMFSLQQRAAETGVPMCLPIEFGECDAGVFSLQSWVDGVELRDVLPDKTDTEQYALGLKAGEYLRKIHEVPAPDGQIDWEQRILQKTDAAIQRHHECPEKFEGDTFVLEYLENNLHLTRERSQSLQHGDFHEGNLMYTADGELYIIDFDRCDYGDPWEEFNRITFDAQASPHFATGKIRGYFNGEPPEKFFETMLFYIARGTASSVAWAYPFGETDVQFMKDLARQVLEWFDNMKNPIPTWYLSDFYIQWVDGLPYKLRESYDMSFLSKYGKVFRIFDDQDSGSICFGVASGDTKCFIKYAGAPTVRSHVSREEAVERMRRTTQIYRDLRHTNLTTMITAGAKKDGFIMMFEWVDVLYMGRQFSESREKFMQLSEAVKHQIYSDILQFHAHVIEKGYVAIDFYDGNIMYEPKREKTIICDIELYARRPYVNEMGRMWGSTMFMSPEEFQKGADIDELTNVYNMGATAFALFGDGRDRCLEKWQLSEGLFHVAKKAVSDERRERYRTIQQLITEWEAAK